jgi:beta-lactamase class A
MAASAGLQRPSIVVRSLDAPEERVEAVLEADLPLYPASTIKTPLVACVLVDVASGRLDLESRHEVTAANMTANDAESPLVPGYRASLRELAELCIERSDNVATNVLFDVAGRERATGTAASRLGLHATAFRRKLSGSDPLIADPGWDGEHRNAHTAADSARLYAAIARDEIPLADVLLAMLERQRWNEKLSMGLRPGDRFAHKTGDTSEVTHDGGILTTESGQRYVVVVHAGMPSNDANAARFGPFMRELRAELP